jgi:hypothetical protein
MAVHTDPSALANDARCFDCYGSSAELMDAIMTYLMVAWANRASDPCAGSTSVWWYQDGSYSGPNKGFIVSTGFNAAIASSAAAVGDPNFADVFWGDSAGIASWWDGTPGGPWLEIYGQGAPNNWKYDYRDSGGLVHGPGNLVGAAGAYSAAQAALTANAGFMCAFV